MTNWKYTESLRRFQHALEACGVNKSLVKRGGKGNASFKSGTNKAPKIAENGEEEGAEMWLDLELKLVADLGLLEGAHEGFGLGHGFLRQTERCSVLVHVVDGSSLQPEYEFDAVHLELELFSPGLAEKPHIVAYNKMDLPEASEKWFSFKGYLENNGIHTFCMSAMNRQGTHDVVCATFELLRKEAKKKKRDVYVEMDGSMNSLLPFRKNIHFRVGRGPYGQGRKQVGAKGEDVVVKVASETLVREAVKGEAAEGEVLLKLVSP